MPATRDALDTLLATLKTELCQPGKLLLPLLSVMNRFPHYSLSSQLPILAQRPDASRVMGFRAWQKAGYNVRKGDTGIAIDAPMLLKPRDETDRADTDAAPRFAYRVVCVFDICQVEPLRGKVVRAPTEVPVATTARAPLTCREQLKAHLVGHDIKLAYETPAGGSYGYTDGRRITVNDALTPAVEFATLVHETAHVRLHFGQVSHDLTTSETEAEAVAYLLCA